MNTRWHLANYRHQYFQIYDGDRWQRIGRIDMLFRHRDTYIACHTTWEGLKLVGFRADLDAARRLVERSAIRLLETQRPYWFAYVKTGG